MRKIRDIAIESKGAFMLLELVFGVVLLSIIAMILTQMSLSLQREAIAKSSISLAQLALSNAADSIRNRLEQEVAFEFINATLRYHQHSITLHNGALLLDGVLLAQDVTRFIVKSLPHKAFSIMLCGGIDKEIFCINRVGWLHE